MKPATKTHLQKDASRDVRRGQSMNASVRTPQPFSSSETISGACTWSTFNFGNVPKFKDLKPTYNWNMMYLKTIQEN